MASEITVRLAERKDCPAIIALKKELSIHSNVADKPMLSLEELEKDGFDTTPPGFQCIVAEVKVPSKKGFLPGEEESQKTVVGFALYFYAYAAWEGKVIHLEDFCTSKSFRGQGIGLALLKELAKIGVKENCGRIQLEVGNWNEIALKFYKKNGGNDTTVSEGWHNFRFDKDAIRKLASSSS